MSLYTYVAGAWTDYLARRRAAGAELRGPVSLLGPRVLARCRDELGNGEELGNNRGPHVRRWGRGREGIAHCAAFLAYQVEEVAAELGDLRPFHARLLELLEHKSWPRWRLSAKALARELAKIGAHVAYSDARPADLVLYERGLDGDWRGHIGILDEVLDDEAVVTIEANVGRYPATVRRMPRRLGRERMIGLVRLP
jgi:hypothetical protein